MDVRSVHSGEPVSVALEYVRQFDFSQLPVYESGEYVGILTTNTIARWIAQQIVDGGVHRDVAISEVMEFREPRDCALLVDRTLTAADAIHQLSYGSPDGGPSQCSYTYRKQVANRPPYTRNCCIRRTYAQRGTEVQLTERKGKPSTTHNHSRRAWAKSSEFRGG